MFILMLIYPLFGLIQVLDGIINRLVASNQSKAYTKRLDRYLIGVVLYFVILYLTTNASEPVINSGQFMILYLFVLPWGLAIYKWRTRAFKVKNLDTEVLHNEEVIDDINRNGYFV